MGRRIKVPAGGAREAALLGALRLGNTRRAASAYAEISAPTFYRMMEDVTFREAVEKAEADAEVTYLARIAAAVDAGTWQAAAWWLERRRYEDFAQRSKVEMTVDLKEEAKRIAEADGLDPAEVMAEAERIMAR